MVLAVTLFAACGSTADSGTGPAPNGESAPTTPADGVLATYTEHAEIGDWHDFSGDTLDGDSIDGSTLRGKVVAMWFWAPWCTICNAEAAAVVRAARRHPDITFLGIAGRDSRDAMQMFVDQYRIGFPTLVDEGGDVWQHFGVSGQPAWVFVTASGDVHRVLGSPNDSELEQVLDALPAA